MAATHRIRPPDVVKAALAGALLDFIYPNIVGALHGRTVMQVWQGVASGWLGKAASRMGWTSAGLGLVTHLGIATAMAATYALAALRLPVLLARPWLCGAIYGLGLYGVMYRIVLPLRFPTAFPRWDGLQSVCDIAIHIGVGLLIALILARAARRTPARASAPA